VEREAARSGLRLLVLPDLAAMSAGQCAAVRRFVENGGSLVASGRSSLLDEDGQPRGDFALGDLFGARYAGARHTVETPGAGEGDTPAVGDWHLGLRHTYLRLPGAGAARHPILEGFADADIVPFGGLLQAVEPLPGAPFAESQVVATFIPPFPVYPPETSWMLSPVTSQPVVIARQHPSGGRVVYFAGDIDRCYGLRRLPDHGRLLANALQWAAGRPAPLQVTGPGTLDCRLYRQGNRLIVHLVNLSGCQGPGPLEEHLPVGPLQVTLRLDPGMAPRRAACRVAGGELPLERVEGGSASPSAEPPVARFTIPRLEDHELIVVE
jgi:hypothetical protein